MFSYKTAIVILNYNGENILKKILSPLLEYYAGKCDIFVIDNNSTDNSLKILAHYKNTIKIIPLDKNYGFAKAYNIFFSSYLDRYYYICLLNNDIIITKNWLENLMETASKYKNWAAVTPLVYYPDSNIIQNAGLDLFKNGYVESRFLYKKDSEVDLSEKEVFGFCGASCLLNANALKKIGFFDETFKFYYEDADLSMRFRLNNYEIIFSPKAKVYHFHSYSITKEKYSLMRLYMLERHRLLFILKYFPYDLLFKTLTYGSLRYYLAKRKENYLKRQKIEVSIFKVIKVILKSHVSILKDVRKVISKKKEFRTDIIKNIFEKYGKS